MTRSELVARARELGFRADGLEKVLRLIDILDRLEAEEGVADRYALKGGTALNLFWLELPRLSIDIDLNFIGDYSAAELREKRPEFERRLIRCAQLAGSRVLREPLEHAGGKYRLRFASLLGGEQNLELDVNYVLRVPLLGTVRRHVAVSGLGTLQVTSYSLEELAAGKFAALVSRSVARDRYDAVRLLDERPGLLEDPGFRAAFLVLIAGAREDVRKRVAGMKPLSPHEVGHQLVPLLRVRAGEEPIDRSTLAARLDQSLVPAVEQLLAFSPREHAFLEAFLDRGELRPELLTKDGALRARILAQPMLRWKLRHVRAYLGLEPLPGGQPPAAAGPDA